MKNATYNTSKQDKKMQTLERKKQRKDKRKALVIFEMLENNK